MHYLPSDEARAKKWLAALVPSATDEKIEEWLKHPQQNRPRFAAVHFSPKMWHFKKKEDFTEAATKKEAGWFLVPDAVPDTHKHHPPPHGLEATWDGDAWRVEEPHGMKRKLDITTADADTPSKRPAPLERAYAHAEQQLKLVAESGHEHHSTTANKHLSSEDAQLVLAEVTALHGKIAVLEKQVAALEKEAIAHPPAAA